MKLSVKLSVYIFRKVYIPLQQRAELIKIKWLESENCQSYVNAYRTDVCVKWLNKLRRRAKVHLPFTVSHERAIIVHKSGCEKYLRIP